MNFHQIINNLKFIYHFYLKSLLIKSFGDKLLSVKLHIVQLVDMLFSDQLVMRLNLTI